MNKLDLEGRSPLHIAALSGHSEAAGKPNKLPSSNPCRGMFDGSG